MLFLTSHEALQLTATFAFTAEYLRSQNAQADLRARICETASRVAFLRAHILAKHEELRPALGQPSRRAIFATT